VVFEAHLVTKATLYSVLFAGVGLLFIALSIPLIQERVPPNSTYGFRTAKSLSDPKIWYAINRTSGIDLLLAGALITIGSVAMLFLGQRLQPIQVVLPLLLLMIFTLSGAALHGYLVLKRL
jgi:uncharacterized membrane protein